MKIALFGGRFDPVHSGHLAIAKQLWKMGLTDEIWFVPDNKHQWNPIVASVCDRLNMLKFAIQSYRKSSFFKVEFFLSDIAVRIGGQTNTIDVVSKLRQEKPEDDFIFICGSDQIPNFYRWTGWDRLEKEVKFLIIPRKGYPIMQLPQNCTLLPDHGYIPLDDASTIIRERIKNTESIHGLVPESVEKYIIEHNLYK